MSAKPTKPPNTSQEDKSVKLREFLKAKKESPGQGASASRNSSKNALSELQITTDPSSLPGFDSSIGYDPNAFAPFGLDATAQTANESQEPNLCTDVNLPAFECVQVLGPPPLPGHSPYHRSVLGVGKTPQIPNAGRKKSIDEDDSASAKKIGIIVAVAVGMVFVLGIGSSMVFFWGSANHSNSTNTNPTPTDATTSETLPLNVEVAQPSIRPELFEGLHRKFISINLRSPGNQLHEIHTELELINLKLRSEREKAVFQKYAKLHINASLLNILNLSVELSKKRTQELIALERETRKVFDQHIKLIPIGEKMMRDSESLRDNPDRPDRVAQWEKGNKGLVDMKTEVVTLQKSLALIEKEMTELDHRLSSGWVIAPEDENANQALRNEGFVFARDRVRKYVEIGLKMDSFATKFSEDLRAVGRSMYGNNKSE